MVYKQTSFCIVHASVSYTECVSAVTIRTFSFTDPVEDVLLTEPDIDSLVSIASLREVTETAYSAQYYYCNFKVVFMYRECILSE